MIYSEVIIAGAGPAGTTCAWRLNKLGIENIIMDKRTFPRQKLCAGWITPKVLDNLDFKPEDYPHGIKHFPRFVINIYGRKINLKTDQYSIRRFEFDNWLLERSKSRLYEHELKIIVKEKDYYIIDGKFKCRYIVGAGGTNCPVYQNLFKPKFPRSSESFISAIEEEFIHESDQQDCILWFFENKLPGYSWFVPKENGYINVGIGGLAGSMKRKNSNIKKQWDLFTTMLIEKNIIKNREFNPKGHNYYIRSKVLNANIDNAFIIGDSAGLATKDLGEGIGPSVESALIAANSIGLSRPFSLDNITKYSLPGLIFSGFRW